MSKTTDGRRRGTRRPGGSRPGRPRRATVVLLVALALGVLAGCNRRLDMYDQPRLRTLRGSSFFADGQSARTLPAGTVARGNLRADDHLYRGVVQDSVLALAPPMPVTRALLERGQERFQVFCTPCHDYVGSGRGMVVRRGFKQPPTFHQDRLRGAPLGYLFDVITNGFGTMSGYASQVPVEDRWAIAAYVRALQWSQNAKLAELPAGERQAFDAALRSAAAPAPPPAKEH